MTNDEILDEISNLFNYGWKELKQDSVFTSIGEANWNMLKTVFDVIIEKRREKETLRMERYGDVECRNLEAVNICPRCCREIPRNRKARFCAYCGQKIKWNDKHIK